MKVNAEDNNLMNTNTIKTHEIEEICKYAQNTFGSQKSGGTGPRVLRASTVPPGMFGS